MALLIGAVFGLAIVGTLWTVAGDQLEELRRPGYWDRDHFGCTFHRGETFAEHRRRCRHGRRWS